MKLALQLVPLIIVGALTTFPRPTSAHSPTDNKQVIVHMDEQGFDPREITVTQKQTVVFENVGKNNRWPASNIHPTHQIYPEFDPKKGIAPGESWSFTFAKTGEWRYHDHLKPELTGKIVVKDRSNIPTSQKGIFERLKSFLTSFSSRLSFIKRFFSAKIDTIPDQNDSRYDPTIAQDSTEIFRNDDELYSYIKKFRPKKTVKRLHELSSTFGSCHDTAHKAGRISYELYKDGAFRECGAECHSGCYHGATEAYFHEHGTANLSTNLKTLCSSELNSFFSHQCVHGIGHGLMAWTDYDLPQALNSCDLLEHRQDSCWTGVFMENIVGSAHYTTYLSPDPQYPCNIVPDKYKSACYFLQTSRMVQLFPGDFAKVAETCSQVPQQYQRSCFESMGRDASGNHRQDAAKAIAECSFAPVGEMRIGCLIGAAQDTFWDPTGTDRALGFCKLLRVKEEKGACYDIIFSRAPEVLALKKDRENFCAKVENGYREKCYTYIK